MPKRKQRLRDMSIKDRNKGLMSRGYPPMSQDEVKTWRGIDAKRDKWRDQKRAQRARRAARLSGGFASGGIPGNFKRMW